MRNAFVDTLYRLAQKDKQILALLGDAGAGVFDKFSIDFPNQFLNMGIAEANMITVAAGLSHQGFIPFTYAIAPHITYRPYEQIRNDVCFNNNNVKIVSVGAGLHYSNQGPTHQSIEDFAVLNVLPNITIFSPSSPMESEQATIAASKIKGPVYIRIGRATDTKEKYAFKVGQGVQLKKGDDAAIIATGATVYDAYTAAHELEREGISTRVINIHTIKPIDKTIIAKAAKETEVIITVEEHQITGGLGDIVASIILEEHNKPIKFKKIGVNDVFCSYCGSYQDIKEHYGLTKEEIIKQIKKLIGGKL